MFLFGIIPYSPYINIPPFVFNGNIIYIIFCLFHSFGDSVGDTDADSFGDSFVNSVADLVVAIFNNLLIYIIYHLLQLKQSPLQCLLAMLLTLSSERVASVKVNR